MTKSKLLLVITFSCLFGYAWPSLADTSLSEFAQFTGEASDDYVGYQDINFAGDINSDGYGDWIVGAFRNDDTATDAGAAYVVYGSADAFSGTASLADAAQFTGEVSGDRAGFSVASAGDVNNDGYSDLLVGAYINDDAGNAAGAAYLIYGQSTQYSGTQSLSNFAQFTGEASSNYAGYAVASAGDINGDRYDDFIVGAAYNDDIGVNAGSIYLVYGQSTQYSGTQNLSSFAQFTGEAATDYAGSEVTSAGDVNNDGYDDVFVGADQNDDAGSSAGAAYLIYGQATQYSGTQSLGSFAEFTGEAASDRAGRSVSTAGDVNNDGYDDLLVGAYANDDAANSAGAAYLVYGQSTQYSGTQSLSNFAQFTGEAATDYAGWSVASAGDVNHDLYSDVLVGATQNDDAATDAGAVYLIYGQSTQYSNTQSLSTVTQFTGEAEDDQVGRSIGAGSDYNGDHYFEILIGAPYVDGNETTDAGAAYLGYLYVDADYDGAPGTEGIIDGSDCDDSNSAVFTNQSFYLDADGDGAGSDTTGSYCSINPPSGYVRNSNDSNDAVYDGTIDFDADGTLAVNDCNDSDPAITTNQTYYVDGDDDGVGGTTTFAVCLTSPPPGYTTTSTDCNDSDSTVNSNQTYYQDADGDGFGNSAVTETICAGGPSSGYVTNSSDEDDTTFGAIDQITVNEDGSITVVYETTASQVIDPFTGTGSILAEVSIDTRRVVVTNGKRLKIYRDGVSQTSKKVNKRKPKQQFMKLKVKQLYTNYESILFASARGTDGKLVVFRLTDTDRLVKRVNKSITLSRRIHAAVVLRARANSRRITVRFDRGDYRVRQAYRLKRAGQLKQL